MTLIELDGVQAINITESTTITHRVIAGTNSPYDRVLSVESFEFNHTDQARERLQQKLIREWVREGWAEDVQTMLLEEIARHAQPQPFVAHVAPGGVG